MKCRSEWHSPAATVRTSTSCGPTVPTCTSSTTSSPGIGSRTRSLHRADTTTVRSYAPSPGRQPSRPKRLRGTRCLLGLGRQCGGFDESAAGVPPSGASAAPLVAAAPSRLGVTARPAAERPLSLAESEFGSTSSRGSRTTSRSENPAPNASKSRYATCCSVALLVCVMPARTASSTVMPAIAPMIGRESECNQRPEPLGYPRDGSSRCSLAERS